MTEGTDIPGIIIAAATLVTSVTAAIVSIMGFRRSGQNTSKIDAQAVKVEEIHKTTNSLSERSNTAERAAGRAEGELAGRAAALNEQAMGAMAREAIRPIAAPAAPVAAPVPAAPVAPHAAPATADVVESVVKSLASDVAQETFQTGVDAIKDQKTNGKKT